MSQELFSKLESEYGLPTGILDAVWSAESSRGKAMKSKAGALGHFQFMPGTATEMGVKDPFDLTDSATGAAKYLSQLLQKFKDPELALAAYNAGPANVSKYGGIPPFQETQNYVSKVKAAMGMSDTEVPEMDFSSAPEMAFPDPKPKADPKMEINWQDALDKEAGFWLPALGGLLGGMGGAAAGAPTGPVGAAAGGFVGGTAGSSLGIWANIKDHPAPIEEKLTYLAKQGAFDALVTGGMVGIGRGVKMLAKLMSRTPEEVKAAEKWFATQGLAVSPTAGSGAKAGINVYRDAAERMGEALDDAVTRVRATFTHTRTPNDVGMAFRKGEEMLHEYRRTQGDLLYAPFRPGGAYASGATADMTPVADEAKSILRDLGKGWKTQFGDNKPQTMKILEEAADLAGSGGTVEELIAKRRQLQSSLASDKLLGTADDWRRRKLFDVIDATLEDALNKTGGPAAVAAYRKANSVYTHLSDVLENELFTQVLKKDPSLAAQYLGKSATVSRINEFHKVTSELVRTRSLPLQAQKDMLNVARAEWLTNNFRNLGDIATLSRAHKDYNPTARETFNALFANTTQKRDLDLIAENARVFENFLKELPQRGEHVAAGAFSLTAAAGSAIAGSPGAVGAMTGLWSMTHIPQMMAKAVVTGDQGLINAFKYVTTWAKRHAPTSVRQTLSRGAMQGTIPPAIAEALAYIHARSKEEGGQ